MNQYDCACADGYTGTHCEVDVDECQEIAICGNYPCNNTFGSFRCLCRTGLTGQGCMQDVDECNDTMACYGNGRCVNQFGTYDCTCDLGYDPETRCELEIGVCPSVQSREEYFDGVANAAEMAESATEEDDTEMVVVLAPAAAVATLSTLVLLGWYLHLKGSDDRDEDAFNAPSSMSVTSNY